MQSLAYNIYDGSETTQFDVSVTPRSDFEGNVTLELLPGAVDSRGDADHGTTSGARFSIRADTRPPRLESAHVEEDRLILVFDEAVDAEQDGDTVPNGAFAVEETLADYTRHTVPLSGTPAANGVNLTLTMSRTLTSETVTVSYTQPQTGGKIADRAGNAAKSFRNASVDVDVLDVSAPPALVPVSSTAIDAHWPESPDAVSYVLRYRQGSGPWTEIPTTDRIAEVTGLTVDTQYEFQLRKVGDGRQSPWSTSVFARTLNLDVSIRPATSNVRPGQDTRFRIELSDTVERLDVRLDYAWAGPYRASTPPETVTVTGGDSVELRVPTRNVQAANGSLTVRILESRAYKTDSSTSTATVGIATPKPITPPPTAQCSSANFAVRQSRTVDVRRA